MKANSKLSILGILDFDTGLRRYRCMVDYAAVTFRPFAALFNV